ncbi:MAG: hypothetical protein ACTSO9_19500 [Candidatus Helarchaeota archaeon]
MPSFADQATGSSIFSHNLSTLILLQSDRFVCNLIYGFNQYATYHATRLLMRPIQLVTETMDYYTLPRLATPPKKSKLKKYIHESLFVAAFLGAAYFLWGNSLFKLLFAGKFGAQKHLLFLLTVLELIILTQIPLANYLQVNGRKKLLWRTGIFSIISIIFVWFVYLTINKFTKLPLAFMPLGVGCVFVARAIFIHFKLKET